MEQPAINERLVRRYLLGELPEDERERLEIGLLTDDGIYEKLTALEDEVEDELIDQYLDGDLTEPEREKFQTVFLRAPERAYKLKLIKDLKERAVVPSYPEAPVRDVKVTEPPRYARWIPAIGVFQNPLFGFSTAMALTLALLFCAWLWIRTNTLEDQLRAAQATHPTDPALKEQVAQLRQRNEELAANLQQSEEQRTTLEQDLASVKGAEDSPNKTSPPNPTFAFVRLSPSLRSSDQTVKTLNIPPGITRARLFLNVERINTKDYKTVRAVVKKQAGPEVWRSDDVKLQSIGNDSARAILTIAAERLPAGRYIAQLEGVTIDGQTEPIALYVFQVAR